MMNLANEIKDAVTIGIGGHIRPDGDCVGSSMALYLYIRKNFPEKDVHVFNEKAEDIFNCIKDIDKVEDAKSCKTKFDCFIAVDTAGDRLGDAEPLFSKALKKINIDHHISNPGTGDANYIVPDASSASELVYDVLDEKLIDKEIAMALYIGIIHDTGVLKYSNTSPKTLKIVANLIEFGFDFPKLIDETFYEKTYLQTMILGRTLAESFLVMDGKVSVGRIDRKTMEFYNAEPYDLDGIVNQLRIIKGVEVGIFMYQLPSKAYKVSLRSRGIVDVARVAEIFGGGGHVRAAGCIVNEDYHDVINNLTAEIEKQLKGVVLD